ncbi:N-acetylglucosamine-6-phosphate deacetylase [Marinicrinis sediminis]|uniref:N-acetylglucosamine-6-phosphate deacetylase n=1 Tax=Marinicrinis sediminis TaxID=1652465 RepID=A0ABW5RF17_9BACL
MTVQAQTQWFEHARIYTGYEVIEEASLLVENSKIAGIYRKGDPMPVLSETCIRVDARDLQLIPGMIDLHVHGGGGGDVMSGDHTQLAAMCDFHAAHGTTSLLATTMSASRERILHALKGVAGYNRQQTNTGARIIGVHLEGPFLHPARTGAQNPAHLRQPNLAECQHYAEASDHQLKLLTIAPELQGAEDVIRWAVDAGITVSIGHSDATHVQMLEAIHWGASQVTHLFNGMRPLHHRDPGVAGTALMHDALCTELICDGIHIHPHLIPWVMAQKPKDKVVCITDCISVAGLTDGTYTLGGLAVELENQIVRLKIDDGEETPEEVTNGTHRESNKRKGSKEGNLAGSTLTMHQALRNTLSYTNLPLEAVIPYFTINAAKQAKVDQTKGSLEIGKDADIVILDHAGNIAATYVEGKRVFAAQNFLSVHSSKSL